ncbi:hypothetical protein ACJX0J_016265, partial [Zea mays]
IINMAKSIVDEHLLADEAVFLKAYFKIYLILIEAELLQGIKTRFTLLNIKDDCPHILLRTRKHKNRLMYGGTGAACVPVHMLHMENI